MKLISLLSIISISAFAGPVPVPSGGGGSGSGTPVTNIVDYSLPALNTWITNTSGSNLDLYANAYCYVTPASSMNLYVDSKSDGANDYTNSVNSTSVSNDNLLGAHLNPGDRYYFDPVSSAVITSCQRVYSPAAQVVVAGVATTDASQLTTGTLDAARLPASVVTNALKVIYPNFPNFIEWWSASDLTNNDSASITSWPGKNGNFLTGANATLNKLAINGTPAVYFSGSSSSILTNLSIPGDLATNGGTVSILFRQLNSGQPFAFSLNGGTATMTALSFGAQIYNYPCWSVYCYLGGSSQPLYQILGNTNQGDNTHVFTLVFNRTNTVAYVDGKHSASTYVLGSAYVASNCWFQGGCSIGDNYAWTHPFKGWISEFLVFSNALNYDQVNYVSSVLLEKNNAVNGSIVLDGDSQISGGVSTVQSPMFGLSKVFQGCSVSMLAVPGFSTAQNIKALPYWVGNSCYSKTKVLVYWPTLINGGESFSTMTNNILNEYATAKTNGWLVVGVAVPSDVTSEANGNRTNWNNFITANWRNYCNGIIDLSRDPKIGLLGTYTNTSYFASDGIHMTNAGFNIVINGYAAPVLKNVLYGSYSCTTTSSPPPTINQPWLCVDTNAPGFFFVNSNGVWIQK